MNHRATADSAYVEGDDDGFHLIVETADGDHFNFKIHGFAEEFHANVKAQIGEWLNEGSRARGSMPAPVTEADLDAYALDDPKRVTVQRMIDRGGW